MKLVKLISTFVLTLLCILGLSSLSYQPSFADNVCGSSAPEEVRRAAGCPETGGNKDELRIVITSILNSIIGVSGLVAAIFVVVGGINYMTSNGDAGKVEKAKKTILYACIGIAVCALAFAIVNWAIDVIGGKQ